MKSHISFHRPMVLAAVAALSFAVFGCGGPDKANIKVRKDNQELHAQIEQLEHQRDADRATIRGYEAHATTVPMLPQERIDDLFTTAGLQFGKLTGGYRPDPNVEGDVMVKVYVVPTDQTGHTLKAAGTFHVELFDLALKNDNRIGQWDFDLKTARDDWYDTALLYNYVLDCPWQTPPQHAKLTLRVTFTDALTQRIVTADREITINPPAGVN